MSIEGDDAPEEVSDSELMARLATGDDLALNVLMDRWAKRVTSFLFKMTGDGEAAADLAQETFVRLYRARGRYKPCGAFSAWLFTIAANLARNHARWRKRHPAVSLEATDGDGAPAMREEADPRPHPDAAVASAERYAAVRRALLDLPENLREALTLFVYEGLGYADIASLAHCSPKAVETRIYRARRILKRRLAGS